MTQFLMLIAVLLPIVTGIAVLCIKRSGKGLHIALFAVLAVEAAVVTVLMLQGSSEQIVLFAMSEELTVALRMDGLSCVFMPVAAYGFLVTEVYAFRYLDHEEAEGSHPETFFHAFYLLSLGALIAMDLAANLITLYFFLEMLTLASMPMVLYERTKEAGAAALKYLFYSIAGAFLGLLAIFILRGYLTTLSFAPGGNLDLQKASGNVRLVFWAVFLGVVGFGVKAGMYPLHGWLPTAHPEAPAPASAVLSGVIAKAGVLAVIRLIYYAVGTGFLRGSWVQTALLILSLMTVFIGSMMAFTEKVLKKRLAFSTVSQISYALFGIFLLTPEGLTGGLLQVLFHAVVKICLFLCAGSVIYNTGLRRTDELAGLGRQMPWTFAGFTAASLSLIGIPPFCGFVSKWVLAQGSLSSGIPVFSWLGPVILILSALLTAGYLLPVSISAFLPGKGEGTLPDGKYNDGGWKIVLPILLLAVLSLVFGLIAPVFSEWAGSVASTLAGGVF